MKTRDNIITLKIAYTTDIPDRIRFYQERYSCLLRIAYNRIKDSNNSLSIKELNDILKGMNNIGLDTYFRNYARDDAKSMYAKDLKCDTPKRIFGGRHNFLERIKGNLDKEEFNSLRLSPIFCEGQAAKKGNCKVQILDYNTILFKPSKKDHIHLNLKGLSKNYKKYFDKLIQHQELKDLPITYKIDANYVYISFNLDKIELDIEGSVPVKDRVFAIDLNPNHIGYTVCDWENSSDFKIVANGVISLEPLNKKLNDLVKQNKLESSDPTKIYYTNKRKYEIIQICKKLTSLAKYYHCELFAMEDLNMSAKDRGKGRHYNKLVNNQWCRELLVNQIRKRCSLSLIRLLEVDPKYTSFIGNLAYQDTNLPDMCLSSIEIGRRAYEFYHQYLIKDKDKQKNIIINNDPQVINSIVQSLEELSLKDTQEPIKDLCSKIKNLKLQYRVQLDKCHAVFSKLYTKRLWSFNTY